jgi:hypothetical protein
MSGWPGLSIRLSIQECWQGSFGGKTKVTQLGAGLALASILRNLPGLFGFIGGFFTALFAEPLRQWIYRPKLSLSFGKSSDFITNTPEIAGLSQHQAFYIRLKVVNSSSRLAKACRAYLVRVEKQVDGKFGPTIYCDSIQLAWSVREGQAFAAIDLPPDVPQFVDVVSTRSISKQFRPLISAIPMRYEALFWETGVFRFQVLVSGDGVKPVRTQLVLHWDGIWDKFRVEQ